MKNGFTLSEGATHVDIYHNNRKAAFTLAEVLITLGIIGVVAALTMPTVIKNYQKQVTVSKLKKNFTTIQQVLKRAESDFGIDITELDDMWVNDTQGLLSKYFLPYLQGAKLCDVQNRYKICGENYKFLNGNQVSNPPFNNVASMILNNGAAIGISSSANGTGRILFIDINGSEKQPNIAGKDFFIFVIKPNNILSVSNLENPNSGWGACNLSAPAVPGWFCASKIIKDGWKISDDYPW